MTQICVLLLADVDFADRPTLVRPSVRPSVHLPEDSNTDLIDRLLARPSGRPSICLDQNQAKSIVRLSVLLADPAVCPSAAYLPKTVRHICVCPPVSGCPSASLTHICACLSAYLLIC